MGQRIRRAASAATKNSIRVLGHEDLAEEVRELVANDPASARQYYLAIRATNRINRGEDPDAVLAHVLPMLESGDGFIA